MSKTKKKKVEQPVLPPDFLIAVAEKGLGFVKDKVEVYGPKDLPVWHHHDNIYLSDNSSLGLETFFLSPEGRDLMEFEAEKLGVDMGCGFFSELGEPEPLDSLWHYELDSLWHYEFGGFMATHKNKHIACLLAFAQLVGVGIPEEYAGQ